MIVIIIIIIVVVYCIKKLKIIPLYQQRQVIVHMYVYIYHSSTFCGQNVFIVIIAVIERESTQYKSDFQWSPAVVA